MGASIHRCGRHGAGTTAGAMRAGSQMRDTSPGKDAGKGTVASMI